MVPDMFGQGFSDDSGVTDTRKLNRWKGAVSFSE